MNTQEFCSHFPPNPFPTEFTGPNGVSVGIGSPAYSFYKGNELCHLFMVNGVPLPVVPDDNIHFGNIFDSDCHAQWVPVLTHPTLGVPFPYIFGDTEILYALEMGTANALHPSSQEPEWFDHGYFQISVNPDANTFLFSSTTLDSDYGFAKKIPDLFDLSGGGFLQSWSADKNVYYYYNYSSGDIAQDLALALDPLRVGNHISSDPLPTQIVHPEAAQNVADMMASRQSTLRRYWDNSDSEGYFQAISDLIPAWRAALSPVG